MEPSPGHKNDFCVRTNKIKRNMGNVYDPRERLPIEVHLPVMDTGFPSIPTDTGRLPGLRFSFADDPLLGYFAARLGLAVDLRARELREQFLGEVETEEPPSETNLEVPPEPVRETRSETRSHRPPSLRTPTRKDPKRVSRRYGQRRESWKSR